MDLIYFILAAYGMTFILVYGKIFEPIRPAKDYSKTWNTLFRCPLCVGLDSIQPVHLILFLPSFQIRGLT